MKIKITPRRFLGIKIAENKKEPEIPARNNSKEIFCNLDDLPMSKVYNMLFLQK